MPLSLAVEMVTITKAFPGVLANDGVSLEVPEGAVLALVGENGAGKSTLMNVLYGIEAPDSGEIFLHGRPVAIRNTREAISLGIGMVHQHFMLVPDLTVLENVILGNEPRKGPGIHWRRARELVQDLCHSYGFSLNLSERTGRLPIGQQQKVEILKLLYRGANVLILDEPTAVLTPQETSELFANIRVLVSQGKTVILITHKLDEVMRVSDRVVVMRKGRVVAGMPTTQTTREEIAYHMVGRDLPGLEARVQRGDQAVQLRVQSLTVLDDAGLPAVRGLDFELRQGEILGFAGVTGNGQRELAEALTGLRPVSAGRVILLGRDVTGFSRNQLRRSGVGYVPEDRTHMGLCLDWKVQDNLIAGFHREPPVSHGILKTLDHRAVRGLADRLVPEFDIRCPSPVTTARTLSGGNQQKVVVAREVSRQPEVLVACEPTRGVDVGAIQFIHNRLLSLRNQGKGVVLISSDLDEVVSLSDRVAVLFRGRIMGIVDPASTTREELGLLMAGITGRKAGD